MERNLLSPPINTVLIGGSVPWSRWCTKGKSTVHCKCTCSRSKGNMQEKLKISIFSCTWLDDRNQQSFFSFQSFPSDVARLRLQCTDSLSLMNQPHCLLVCFRNEKTYGHTTKDWNSCPSFKVLRTWHVKHEINCLSWNRFWLPKNEAQL